MVLALAMFFAAACYAFWSLRAPIRPWNDFAFVYAAGRSWLGGFSPYEFDRWNAEWAAVRPPETHVAQPMPFMYLPHWAPLAVTLGSLPWPVATRVWDAMNVIAHLATCAIGVALLGGSLRAQLQRPSVWMFLAFATFNPAIRYSVWQSQMTLLPTLGMVGAFWAWREKRTAWLAFFGFLASLKPQLSLLALLYLLLNGGHAGLLWGGGASVIVGLAAMVPSHLGRMASDVAHCYRLHMQLDFNAPSQFFSVPALLASVVSGHEFMLISIVAGISSVVALTVARRAGGTWKDPLFQLGAVVAMSAAWMPVHGYDLVIYTPLVILAEEVRSSRLGWAMIPLVWSAGRPVFIATHLPFFPHPASFLTAAIALLVVATARLRHEHRHAVLEPTEAD
jgi:hypothetical protein